MECRWKNCEEIFNNQKDFAAHVNRHIKDPEIKTCYWKDCKRSLDKKISKCMLLTHMRMHTREKPFKCRQCNKEYSRPDALNKHSKTHEQIAADEGIYIKKIAYLSQLLHENEAALKNMQQKYKRLIVENEIFLNEICSTSQRTWRGKNTSPQ